MLAGTALTVAACTGGSEPAKPTGPPSPDQSNLGEVIDEAPTLRPLALDRKPLWKQSTKGTIEAVSGGALRGDTAILVAGNEKGDDDRLVVADATTGKVRCTGKAAKAANRLRGILATTDGRIALATVAPSPSTRFTDIRLVAIDGTTGRSLWTRSGVQPTLIAGSTVLGRVPTREGQSTLDVSSGSVIALDAATGRTRWELSARFSHRADRRRDGPGQGGEGRPARAALAPRRRDRPRDRPPTEWAERAARAMR